MLAKKNRLTTNDLKNVGRFSLYRGVYCDVKKLHSYTNKYGVIISAKTFKKAVERNKVKRLFYRILQDELKKENILLLQNSFLFYPKKITRHESEDVIKKEIIISLEIK